jgi:chromosome segregation ATPase
VPTRPDGQRVLTALNDATGQGDEISVSGIARRAGVDRSFLYRHRDLLEQIHALEAQPPNGATVGPAISRASLHADLLNAQQRAARLAARIHQLEQRLSETLGQQAWHESGLGAPDDIDQLKQRIVTLKQHTIDLRLQLEERDQDLDAARAANRELITQINTPRPAP